MLRERLSNVAVFAGAAENPGLGVENWMTTTTALGVEQVAC
jgi:hypothetical protein